MSNTTFFHGFDQFSSNFVRHEMLSEHFRKHKPVGPTTGRAILFERLCHTVPGNMSVNDVLRHFLKDNGYEYVNHLGQVWFLYRGNWHNCEHRTEDGVIRFFMLEYEMG